MQASSASASKAAGTPFAHGGRLRIVDQPHNHQQQVGLALRQSLPEPSLEVELRPRQISSSLANICSHFIANVRQWRWGDGVRIMAIPRPQSQSWCRADCPREARAVAGRSALIVSGKHDSARRFSDASAISQKPYPAEIAVLSERASRCRCGRKCDR